MLANSYTFNSFGNLTDSTGTLISPFQYTERESDAETGLYYYPTRYYDHSSGRFISKDPIRFASDVNFSALPACVMRCPRMLTRERL